MLLLLSLIILCSGAFVKTQEISCKDIACLESLLISLVEKQSIPKIVNSQNHKNYQENINREELAAFFQTWKTKGMDTVSFDKIRTSFNYPEATEALMSKPLQYLPAQHPNLSDNFGKRTESTYSKPQHIHVHHHYIKLTPKKDTFITQNIQNEDLPEINPSEPKTVKLISSSPKVNSINNDAQSHSDDFFINTVKSTGTISEISGAQSPFKNCSSSTLTPSKIYNVSSVGEVELSNKIHNETTSSEQTDETQFTMLSQSEENFSDNFSTTVTPLYNEHSAFGVPLN